MAFNFPGPYEIRLFYTTTPVGFPSIQHVAKYNLNVSPAPAAGDPFSSIQAVNRAGTTTALNTWVDGWVALLQALISSNANNSIDFAELWKYAPQSFDATFISSYSIAAVGLSSAAAVPAGQSIQTYRTTEGGIMKLSFMETGLLTAQRDPPPFTPVGSENIRLTIVATTNCWIARDTSYPIAAVANFAGQNEALFKKRYRQS